MNQELTQLVQELLSKMGWEDSNVIIREGANAQETDIVIKTYEARYLIGSAGQNLKALEHIVRIIAYKKFPEIKKVTVDINEYRKERERQLREIARMAAQKAIQTNSAVKLPPMNAFERKIIHTELSIRPDVTTESQGDPPRRQLIVKPYT